MIYFDYNATTRVADAVYDAMLPYLDTSFGNPSSAYSFSSDSRRVIDEARSDVALLLGASLADEITFTSGGTESDNWAILGSLESNPEKTHIITTQVEHEAVRNLCKRCESRGFDVTWLDVDENGTLDLETLRSSLGKDTAVVSVMLANNETGILFPVEEIGAIVKANSDALFHVDGVNAAGKIPIDLKNSNIDLFSISGHKFHAPKGIGALYIRSGIDLPPYLTGGGQQNGKRAGTEAVHQIAGIGTAAKLAADLGPMKQVEALRDRLETFILNAIPDTRLNGTNDASLRLPNTSNISFVNTNGEMILSALDDVGICVSTGSACNSLDNRASPVLAAMNIPYSSAMGSIRFSLGRYSTDDEVDLVLTELPRIIDDLR